MAVDQDHTCYAVRRGELIANNYLLGEVLGIGGMGVVYAALQRSLDRIVALKMPRPELSADVQVKKRLRREAIASSRLTHRNSVSVFDYGYHGGVPFIVMELVAGVRLAQLLAEHGPLPVPIAVRLIRQVTSVLEEAHVNRVVHADVKCDNILVETMRDGALVPRLIDWGIARLDDRRDTGDESFVTGTPEYLAPEVVVGARPTAAADVYALGVMLYELISGTTPFAGSPQILVSKLNDQPVPLAARCPELEISVSLDALVRRTLARNPASRFADAVALAHALDALPISASETTTTVRPGTSRIFSTESTTTKMSVAHALDDAPPRSPISRARAAVVSALQEGDVDAIVVSYLELARTLVDDHRLDRAVIELEHAVALVSGSASPAPVWRLLLTLAALYDGNGDHERARATAHAARQAATRVSSMQGCERAERLVARLSRMQLAERQR